MNQTRKNLLSYSNSGIHSLKIIQKSHLSSEDMLELVYSLLDYVSPYILKHKNSIKITFPKGYSKEDIFHNITPKAFNDYLTVLARLLNNAKHNHIKLSEKTKFVCEISDKLDSFNLHHHLDPELNKIQHMSTAELIKRVKEAGAY